MRIYIYSEGLRRRRHIGIVQPPDARPIQLTKRMSLAMLKKIARANMFKAPADKIDAILQDDHIPLLQFKNFQGSWQLDVSSYDPEPDVAKVLFQETVVISQIWPESHGNLKDNALPACQL
jgi:hypothetical protein